METPKLKNILTELLKEGQSVEIQASGYSMFPLLLPGDTLQLQRQDKYHRGDIIVFDRGDVLVAHRCYKITDDELISKGDGFSWFDQSIKLNLVVASVTHRIRNGKRECLSNRKFVYWSKLMLMYPRFWGVIFHFFAKVYHRIK